MLKAVSIKQPYAQLIYWGIIKALPMSWWTDYRGRLGLYVSEKWIEDKPHDVKKYSSHYKILKVFTKKQWLSLDFKIRNKLLNEKFFSGMIIGEIELINIKKGMESIFVKRGELAWIVKMIKRYVMPIEIKGEEIGLWPYRR